MKNEFANEFEAIYMSHVFPRGIMFDAVTENGEEITTKERKRVNLLLQLRAQYAMLVSLFGNLHMSFVQEFNVWKKHRRAGYYKKLPSTKIYHALFPCDFENWTSAVSVKDIINSALYSTSVRSVILPVSDLQQRVDSLRSLMGSRLTNRDEHQEGVDVNHQLHFVQGIDDLGYSSGWFFNFHPHVVTFENPVLLTGGDLVKLSSVVDMYYRLKETLERVLVEFDLDSSKTVKQCKQYEKRLSKYIAVLDAYRLRRQKIAASGLRRMYLDKLYTNIEFVKRQRVGVWKN